MKVIFQILSVFLIFSIISSHPHILKNLKENIKNSPRNKPLDFVKRNEEIKIKLEKEKLTVEGKALSLEQIAKGKGEALERKEEQKREIRSLEDIMIARPVKVEPIP